MDGDAESEGCVWGATGEDAERENGLCEVFDVLHRGEWPKSGEAMKAAEKDAGSEFWSKFK